MTIPMPVLTSLVYCLKNDKVLLAKRKKKPFVGYWIAPGGKLKPGESPYHCAIRELAEETGLLAENAKLRGIITETSPRPDWQWMIFIYVVTCFQGTVTSDEREGELCWWSLKECANLQMPDTDRLFFNQVLDLSQPIYQATFRYEDDLSIADFAEHPDQV